MSALVGGPTAEEYDLRQSAARDNRVIVPIALLVVLLILIGAAARRRRAAGPDRDGDPLLRSGARRRDLLLRARLRLPGLDPWLPLFAFVFLVALGIDYNIFLMARVREETLTHGTRRGCCAASRSPAAVITSAGIVLAGTFSALAVLPLVILTEIGFTIAVGVLIDTFIVRTVLVPALVLRSATRSGGRRRWRGRGWRPA